MKVALQGCSCSGGKALGLDLQPAVVAKLGAVAVGAALGAKVGGALGAFVAAIAVQVAFGS